MHQSTMHIDLWIVCLFYCCMEVWTLSPEQFKSRSIYQVFTDRFAATVTPPSCDPAQKKYCGGTFAGNQFIIENTWAVTGT